jgi:hypothetical protein
MNGPFMRPFQWVSGGFLMTTITKRLGALALATGLGVAGCYDLASQQTARVAGAFLPRLSAAGAQNPGIVQIQDPSAFSRVVALSDVHGMADNLMPLLRAGQIIDSQGRWAGGRTLLVVVGDNIDKGPKSLEVLDLWLSLTPQAKAAGGGIISLLGNHEAEFLASPSADAKASGLLAELQAHGLPLTNLTDPTQPRGAFLRQLPLAARVGRWLFCHAGLYPAMAWPAFAQQAAQTLNANAYGDPFITGPNSILEAKDWWQLPATRSSLEARLESMGDFGLVQGHQPKAYNIPNTIGAIDGGRLIKIDNGMAPEAGSNPGHLLVFTQPAQMNLDAYPAVLTIAQDGTSRPLIPAN